MNMDLKASALFLSCSLTEKLAVVTEHRPSCSQLTGNDERKQIRLTCMIVCANVSCYWIEAMGCAMLIYLCWWACSMQWIFTKNAFKHVPWGLHQNSSPHLLNHSAGWGMVGVVQESTGPHQITSWHMCMRSIYAELFSSHQSWWIILDAKHSESMQAKGG